MRNIARIAAAIAPCNPLQRWRVRWTARARMQMQHPTGAHLGCHLTLNSSRCRQTVPLLLLRTAGCPPTVWTRATCTTAHGTQVQTSQVEIKLYARLNMLLEYLSSRLHQNKRRENARQRCAHVFAITAGPEMWAWQLHPHSCKTQKDAPIFPGIGVFSCFCSAHSVQEKTHL